METRPDPLATRLGTIAVGLASLLFALALSIGLTALPIETMLLVWGVGVAWAAVASVAEGHLTLPRARAGVRPLL